MSLNFFTSLPRLTITCFFFPSASSALLILLFSSTSISSLMSSGSSTLLWDENLLSFIIAGAKETSISFEI
jgi:hypothetical protein